MKILVGYRVPTGEPFYLERMHHVMITGITQWAGKTTALEALVSRSGLRAIAFLTKPEEQEFGGNHLPLFFQERADWQYVESLIAATLREDQRFNRSFIIRASRGCKTLREVWQKIRTAKDESRSGSFVEGVYTNLDAYMEIVVPQIEKYEFAEDVVLKDGLNVMDLSEMSDEMQALVIRSVMERLVQTKQSGVVVIIPEAWKFIGEHYTPVQFIAEKMIRQGASSRVYVWNDSQNLSGISGAIRGQVGIWLLGVQRYEHEVERTIRAVPLENKPKKAEIMSLKTGEFIVCTRREVARVYVQPSWLPEGVAQRVAKGEIESDSEEVQKWKKTYDTDEAVPAAELLTEEEDWSDVMERIEEVEAKLK